MVVSLPKTGRTIELCNEPEILQCPETFPKHSASKLSRSCCMLVFFVACNKTSFWDEIQGYESWNQAPDWTGIQPSCDGTHGPYVQIWYNDEAASLVDGSATTASEGAIFVKEAYDEDATTLKSIAAAQKTAGFDPDHGDWYSGMFSPEGEASQKGSVAGCYGCHEAGTDYTLFLSSPVVTSLEDCP
jgi:hypothetical protein